jgi:hypothetical protein
MGILVRQFAEDAPRSTREPRNMSSTAQFVGTLFAFFCFEGLQEDFQADARERTLANLIRDGLTMLGRINP